MHISAKEERGRRFKLALRAGIPILLLISLLFYTTFSRGGFTTPTVENIFLMAGMVFITVYFIYFLLELDAKETLLDQITKSYNYEAFIGKIKKHRPETLAILYINNLSTINENYGTNATNGLLQSIVFKLENSFHIHRIKESWIGRNFGAELLITANISSKDLKKLIEKFILENQTIESIEVDYSFAIITPGKADPEKAIALLRDTLYSQKNKAAEKSDKIESVDDLTELEKRTISALENESINLYFRPLYNIRKKGVDSYEIAAKLRADNGKEILPRDYLPIVNRLGLGRTYDLTLFRHIVKIANLTDEHISFSFNLSPFSLRDQKFLGKIFNITEEDKIDTKRLIIELYERKTHHNLSSYLKTLSQIRSKGFQICIDNFGSSNASMEYMKHFNFDRVQFDRDFVSNLDDPNSLSILKSLVDMSKGMQITTVAKWVDKDEQKQRLTELGVDYLQGFGIGRQLTEKQLIERYNR